MASSSNDISYGMNILDDPSESHYYYPIILGIIVLIAVLNFITILNNQNDTSEVIQPDNATYISGPTEPSGSLGSMNKQKRRLMVNYLIAYLLSKGSLWAKLPYIYLFYYTVPKFSYFTISIFYIVDYLAGFLTATLTGWIADIYGRKFMSSFYNVMMPISVLTRLTGNLELSYIGQISNGISYPLLKTSFESWVVCEAGKIVPDEHERECFLKRLFKTQIMYDGIISIFISAIAAVIFSSYGIYNPFYFSVSLNLLGFIYILFFWRENKPSQEESNTIGGAWNEMLSKKDVMIVGTIEALTFAMQNVYLFCWVPYLISLSSQDNINVGFAFVCIVLTMISGTQLFEILVIQLDISYYIVLPYCIGIQLSVFIVSYFTRSYLIGLLAMGFINCGFGFYRPLNSTIKSRIIIEKYRAQLMSFFRLPLNICVILLLLAAKVFSPSSVMFFKLILSCF